MLRPRGTSSLTPSDPQHSELPRASQPPISQRPSWSCLGLSRLSSPSLLSRSSTRALLHFLSRLPFRPDLHLHQARPQDLVLEEITPPYLFNDHILPSTLPSLDLIDRLMQPRVERPTHGLYPLYTLRQR